MILIKSAMKMVSISKKRRGFGRNKMEADI
jgi:hypothetical protein